MKKNRIVRSFQPDPDVRDMLEKAASAGLEITPILNEATRKCGPDIIERMAADRLKKIQELSFFDPQVLLPGIAA